MCVRYPGFLPHRDGRANGLGATFEKKARHTAAGAFSRSRPRSGYDGRLRLPSTAGADRCSSYPGPPRRSIADVPVTGFRRQAPIRRSTCLLPSSPDPAASSARSQSRHFVEAGYDVVGLDNDMRAHFFGPAASTQPVTDALRERYPGVPRRSMSTSATRSRSMRSSRDTPSSSRSSCTRRRSPRTTGRRRIPRPTSRSTPMGL